GGVRGGGGQGGGGGGGIGDVVGGVVARALIDEVRGKGVAVVGAPRGEDIVPGGGVGVGVGPRRSVEAGLPEGERALPLGLLEDADPLLRAEVGGLGDVAECASVCKKPLGQIAPRRRRRGGGDLHRGAGGGAAPGQGTTS